MPGPTSARILVTFGSRRGGTAEIAERLASTLRERGHDVDCRRAAEVDDVSPFDTVIVGGALYAQRWVREARRFVKRQAVALRARRVWMFSSGPLDTSATDGVIPPTHNVAHLMALVGARGHATFGGRLAPDATGFVAAAMAKTRAGDWRDWDRVQHWAEDVSTTVTAEPPWVIAAREPPARWPLAALCAVVAVTAIGGGIALIAAPDGSLVHASTALLRHSPFASFLVPGLVLLGVIGLGHLLATIALARRWTFAYELAFAAGAALLIWIATEIAMLRVFHVMQAVYLVAAVAIMVLALRGTHATRSAAPASPRRASHGAPVPRARAARPA